MSASGARLSALTRELARRWQETREHWTDARSAEFERRYLRELFATAERSLGSLEELERLVARIRKDCE